MGVYICEELDINFEDEMINICVSVADWFTTSISNDGYRVTLLSTLTTHDCVLCIHVSCITLILRGFCLAIASHKKQCCAHTMSYNYKLPYKEGFKSVTNVREDLLLLSQQV